MASSSTQSKIVLMSMGALLVSGLLLFFGTGLHPVWWLIWFAPLPVLLIAPRVGAWPAFGIAALSWFAGGLNLWHYLIGLIQLPVAIFLAIVGAASVVFGLAVLLHRVFILRQSVWFAAISFPTLWVTFEYIISIASPHGTFGNIAYSQMNLLPLLQFASVTGILGISFYLCLLPSTAAAIINLPTDKTRNVRLAILVGGFLIAVLGYGSWRLRSTPIAPHLVTVAMMSSDLPQNVFPQTDAATLKLFRDYVEQINHLPEPFGHNSASGNNLVIVLPEKIGVLSDQGTEEMDTLFKAMAAQTSSHIFVSVDQGSSEERFNEGRLYSPQAAVKAVYRKHHMIPGLESMDRPGTERSALHEPSGTWGLEICKDLDFPELSRQYGNDGVGLLLVPAWDFVIDDWLHSRMAVMRGVESGFTIARAAKQGVLTVSDDRGRIVAEASSGGLPFSSLITTAPVLHDNTLYDRWGDWFAWLNIVILVGVLGSLGRRPAF